MANRYLLHFAHEHNPFRWPEFLALASKNDCEFNLISEERHILTRPYVLLELTDNSHHDSLVQSAKESHLLKDLYELWAHSNESIEDMEVQASKSAQFLSGLYARPDQTFRVNCESFGAKLPQPTKVEYIRKMHFMDSFRSKPDLKNPKQIYCIFEMNAGTNSRQTDNTTKEYYFGRHLARSSRSSVDDYCLRNRKFIANTSMDPLLSMVAANIAKVKPNDLVLDPFAGSGGLLVAAASKGAYALGSDIDWLLVHGKSRPSRVGDTKRQDGECIRANFKQYGFEHRYIDAMVADISRSPFKESLQVDSIIADPPYGVRECMEKIGGKKERQPIEEGRVRYPAKMRCGMDELLSDFMHLSAKQLKISGRLVYFLPVIREDQNFRDFIPTHPCLKLLSYSEQCLTTNVYRLLVAMEKIKDLSEGDIVTIPQARHEMNFRRAYFGGKG